MAGNFEQATTPDGLPKWETMNVPATDTKKMNELGDKGWEPVAGAGNTVVLKRPVKKTEPGYGYGR